ncbi:hypothetical protein AURDEDRAFT_175785 [Auricularia subglabra TFB-10046 SS5]|uniref:MYND-type domain-containing protein n=1 Tax=Auricularia subglabra (strain TFB-10046 / SS5) TaxID=717982 RepID=J0LE97_AURST|nr:hypothetical protein AURDEDRAFT_175785 [Auricularia subglabra TFB-10046 SS5]
MATAAVTLTTQLQNTERPAVCAKCLYVFAQALSDKENEAIAVALLKSHHAFFTACAKVASAPGATGDLSPLRSTLNANAAACPNKRYHAFASLALGDSVACVMDALCQCLFAAVCRGSQKKHNKILLSKNGMWPSSLEELIPTDVKAYARWAGTLPRWHAIAFLSRLLIVARRKVMEDLSLSPARDRICSTMVRSMRLWRVPESEFRPEIRPYLSHDVPLGRPPIQDAAQILGQVVGLLVIFEDGPNRLLDDFRFFSDGYERILHDAIVAFLEKPTCPLDAKHRDTLVGAASMLSSRGNLPVHPLVEQSRQPTSPTGHNLARDGLNLAHTILVYLEQRRDDRTCAGPGCTSYAREGETGTRALSLCGKCKFLRYCSPECQKRDWTVGRDDVPHKVICSALCKFERAGVSPRATSMDAFSRVYFDNTTLTDEEFTWLAKWTLLDDRLPYEFKLGALNLFMRQSRDAARQGIFWP